MAFLARKPPYKNPYRLYVLAVLTAVSTLTVTDRVLMGLLLEPIKQELQLTDTQLGFLTGIAFALFYSILGLPIARWADVGNRVLIAAASIGLWGLTMLLCFYASGFYLLLFARVCAAVGEAGSMPPTYSLVGDYFAASAERAKAMAVYMSASALASLFGFIGGGWLNERYGWRTTFILFGMFGIALALLVMRTIAEPRATNFKRPLSHVSAPSMASVLATLWKCRSLRHLSVALILVYTFGLGLSPWYAAFMIRNHGVGTAELGVWFALIFGLGGVAGTWLGGHLAAGALANKESNQMKWAAWTIVSFVPCFVAFLHSASQASALLALLPVAVIFGVFLGPTFALLQRLVPDDRRATTMAVVMLLANLIGMGFGPQTVGVISDVLRPQFGSTNSLRYAMLVLSLIAFWAAYHFRVVARTIEHDVSAVTERLEVAATASR